MQFEEMLAIVSPAYREEIISGQVNDCLAEFIVIELRESFNPEAADDVQLNDAFDVIRKAAREISEVITAQSRDHLDPTRPYNLH